MVLLRDHEQAVRETLGSERMHVETIFSEKVDGVEYLYWYSIQSEGGSDVESSGHWLDRAPSTSGGGASTPPSRRRTSPSASTW